MIAPVGLWLFGIVVSLVIADTFSRIFVPFDFSGNDGGADARVWR